MDTLFELGVNLSKGLQANEKDIARTLARSDNPQTSKDAAVKMVESGALNRQEKDVYHRAVQFIAYFRNPDDFTAKEISAGSAIDYYTVQRRLSGLRNKGKIKRTGEKRDGCCIWKLTN